MQSPTILAVLAHPDDETFGMGGTLAYYAKKGCSVYLVCATRGEAGDVSPDFLQKFNSIAELREGELRCAAGILGLSGVYMLDYRDSGMPGSPDNDHQKALMTAPFNEVVEKVVHYIRLLKPQIVLTFDPIGGYRHPDHIAIQKATDKAFYLSGDSTAFQTSLPAYQPQKLYFHTIPHGFLRLIVKVMPLFGKDPRKFGKNQDINLLSITEVNFPTHAAIRYHSVAKLKGQASACHASQGGGNMNRGILGWWRILLASKDTFMRAYPLPKRGEAVEKDLFKDVKF